MKRLICLVLIFLATCSYMKAQELQAKITINHNQIQGTDASVFESLQQTLEQFINDRQWTDYQFQNVIFRQEGVAVPEVQTNVPAAGQYFVRVRATDSSGKTQDAFDYYVTDNGKNYGMKCFYVTADQRIEEDIYEEN